MKRASMVLLTLAAGVTAGAAAQQPKAITMADIAGVWDAKSMVGPRDSVVVTDVLTITADGKGWTMAFPNRAEPVPVRVMSMAGDSVDTDAGPYPSVLRAGQMVTVHMMAHFKGDSMWGTAVAAYASGDKVNLKVAGTRRKK